MGESVATLTCSTLADACTIYELAYAFDALFDEVDDNGSDTFGRWQ